MVEDTCASSLVDGPVPSKYPMGFAQDDSLADQPGRQYCFHDWTGILVLVD
jgi:hypothetical protein